MSKKNILKENMKRFNTKNLDEGYAWERKDGQPLPTLNDVQKEHNKKISESPIQYNPNNYESAKPSNINSLLEDAEEELESVVNKLSTDSNVSTSDKLVYLQSLKKINYIIDRLQNKDLSGYFE